MLSFKFLKQAILYSLIAFAFGLSGCEDKDPCSDSTGNEVADGLWTEGTTLTIWDTERQAMRLPYPDFESIEIEAWVRNHNTFAGDYAYVPDFSSGVFAGGIDIPPYIYGDSAYRYIGTGEMYVCPRPEWGENVYQIPFTVKFSEYDTRDSLCIIIRANEPCEGGKDVWEYYLNGELIHASSEHNYGRGRSFPIVLKKP